MPQRFVGQPLPRLEDGRLLRGEGRFTDDWSLPDQTWAAFVRSPHAHARIGSISTQAARDRPGVLAVLTAADYVADGCLGIRHAPIPADTLDVTRPAFGPADARPPLDEPQFPLALERVRYPGEAVAVVIAESPTLARDAADLVAVDYQVLPAVAEAEAALRQTAPVLSAAAADNLAVSAVLGDLDAAARALATSEVVVEHEFRIQRIANAQMEPRAAIGNYDPASDTYLMIAGSQGVLRQRATLAAALNVPPDRIRVISPDVGGGFGPRTSLYPEQVVVVWAARRVGRPVRWTSGRSEAFLSDFQGRDATAHARLGLDRHGRMHALQVDFLFNIGAYTGSYVPLSNAARIMTSAYDVPAASVRVRGALTNTVPTGPYRGAGRPEAMFVLERLLDHAADCLDLDRAELRRRNLVRREQLPYRSAMGLTYDSGAFDHNFRRALELADWSGFPERRAAAAARGRLAGISVANYVESPVGAPHERVRLTILPHGRVELVVGTQSTGQGHATAFAQVVADELHVRPDQVDLVSGDTERVSVGGGTHSDRSMRLVGALLVQACASLREQLDEFDPDHSESPFAVARRATLTAEASFSGRMPAHPTGAAVCELEIDPETGHLEITRYTCVDDVGQPINPLILEGQAHGGIVQGVGQALSEGVSFDPATAQVLTASFLDYALLRARSLPHFATELTEDPTPSNPLRVKGGGESGITPALAIVVNAALDALRPLGVTDLDMPLSPARIWAAIASARSAPGATLEPTTVT
jgi:carbon-monoxide dehydrogenase large subunit